MDVAYDAKPIHSFISTQNRVPIIDGHKKKSNAVIWDLLHNRNENSAILIVR